MKFVCLDMQTASYDRDSTCALGVVLISDQNEISRKSLVVRPPRLKFERSHLHGIRRQDVRRAPPFARAWEVLRELFDQADYIVAYDAATQRQILWSTCTASGVQTPPQPFICVKRLAQSFWEMDDAPLSALAEKIGVPLVRHQAMSEADVVSKIITAFLAEGHNVERASLSPAPPIGSLPVTQVRRNWWPAMRRALGAMFLLGLVGGSLWLVAQNPVFFCHVYKMLESLFN